MMVSWLLHPLAVHAVVATAMCLCVYLFVSSKRELQSEQKSWSASRTALEAQMQRMQEELEELRNVACEAVAEPPARGEASRPASLAPMEERTRAEALALRNAGFPAERIAPVLQVPENEVELLLKIQRLTA